MFQKIYGVLGVLPLTSEFGYPNSVLGKTYRIYSLYPFDNDRIKLHIEITVTHFKFITSQNRKNRGAFVKKTSRLCKLPVKFFFSLKFHKFICKFFGCFTILINTNCFFVILCCSCPIKSSMNNCLQINYAELIVHYIFVK